MSDPTIGASLEPDPAPPQRRPAMDRQAFDSLPIPTQLIIWAACVGLGILMVGVPLAVIARVLGL